MKGLYTKNRDTITLAELARFIGQSYNDVYRYTFTTDFPFRVQRGQKRYWRRYDVYQWCIRNRFKTADEIVEQTRADRAADDEAKAALREYQKIKQRESRAARA